MMTLNLNAAHTSTRVEFIGKTKPFGKDVKNMDIKELAKLSAEKMAGEIEKQFNDYDKKKKITTKSQK